jgi:hypothetical protein
MFTALRPGSPFPDAVPLSAPTRPAEPPGEAPTRSPFPDLAEALAAIPDPRGRQGRQHPAVPMLLAVVYALLCGKPHPAAIAEWVAAHSQAWLRDTLGFPRPNRPGRTTFYLFLRRLDWQALEKALCHWIYQVATARGFQLAPEAVALDGKEARGVRRMRGEALVLVSAFTHASGLTLALRACPEGGEQEAVRTLLEELTLLNRVVTADALHTQRETCAVVLDRSVARKGQPAASARSSARVVGALAGSGPGSGPRDDRGPSAWAAGNPDAGGRLGLGRGKRLARATAGLLPDP